MSPPGNVPGGGASLASNGEESAGPGPGVFFGPGHRVRGCRPSELAAVPGALARRPRHLISKEPGQATFDAADYLSDLVACVDELQSGGFLDGVSEVALDCQWHSVLAIGPDGRPETDVVSWADTRPATPAPGLYTGGRSRSSASGRAAPSPRCTGHGGCRGCGQSWAPPGPARLLGPVRRAI